MSTQYFIWQEQNSFFFRIQETFIIIDHILRYKASLSKYKNQNNSFHPLSHHNGWLLENKTYSIYKWVWEKFIYTLRRTKFDPYFSPFTKVNSEWVKYLGITQETLQLLDKSWAELFNILTQATIALTKFLKHEK